jgi:hypothetical protein
VRADLVGAPRVELQTDQRVETMLSRYVIVHGAALYPLAFRTP